MQPNRELWKQVRRMALPPRRDTRVDLDKDDPVRDVLLRRRAAVEVALKSTRGLRQGGDIGATLDKKVAELKAVTASPPQGGPGAVSARYFGVQENTTVPLVDLDVQLLVGKKVVAEGKTDGTGGIVLPLPCEDDSGDTDEGKDQDPHQPPDNRRPMDYELQALAPDCTVVACDKGRATCADAPSHTVTIGYQPILEPSFRAGAFWDEAIAIARQTADELTATATRGLELQEKELTILLEQIDRALECEPCPPDMPREPRREPGERPGKRDTVLDQAKSTAEEARAAAEEAWAHADAAKADAHAARAELVEARAAIDAAKKEAEAAKPKTRVRRKRTTKRKTTRSESTPPPSDEKED